MADPIEAAARAAFAVHHSKPNIVKWEDRSEAMREVFRAEVRAALAAHSPERERRVSELVAAARAYRDAETDGTPRMWRGKALQDLADVLDSALAPFAEGK